MPRKINVNEELQKGRFGVPVLGAQAMFWKAEDVEIRPSFISIRSTLRGSRFLDRG